PEKRPRRFAYRCSPAPPPRRAEQPARRQRRHSNIPAIGGQSLRRAANAAPRQERQPPREVPERPEPSRKPANRRAGRPEGDAPSHRRQPQLTTQTPPGAKSEIPVGDAQGRPLPAPPSTESPGS